MTQSVAAVCGTATALPVEPTPTEPFETPSHDALAHLVEAPPPDAIARRVETPATREMFIGRAENGRDMAGPVVVDGEAVTLHRVNGDDVAFLRRTLNDPAVRRHLLATEQSTPFEAAGSDDCTADDTRLPLLVCVDGDPAGAVALMGIVPAFGIADIGYLVAPDYWGNGYATAAVSLLVDHGFSDRGLRTVRASVVPENEASRRVLEKVGFERERDASEQAVADGGDVSLHRYQLCKRDWEGDMR